MYKALGRFTMVLLISISTRAVSALTCGYILVTTQVSVPGHEWEPRQYYDLVCWDGQGPPPPEGGDADPSLPPPPPLPTVRIVSASDQDPHQVTLNFEYTGNPTSMTLTRDATTLSSGPVSSYGFYGSLNDMTQNPNLTVTMCNAAGCAADSAVVTRSHQVKRVEGAISAQWADVVPMDWYSIVVKVGYESYSRMLDVRFQYADYSVATVGARNGYAQHVESADALLWEDGKRTPYWQVEYQLWPAYLGGLYSETAVQSGGCNVPTWRLPNQSPRCTYTAEFAQPGTPGSGVIVIAYAEGSAGVYNPHPDGAVVLDVFP